MENSLFLYKNSCEMEAIQPLYQSFKKKTFSLRITSQENKFIEDNNLNKLINRSKNYGSFNKKFIYKNKS